MRRIWDAENTKVYMAGTEKNIIGRTDLLSCFGIYFLEVSSGKEKKATLKGLTGKLLRRRSPNIQNKCLKKRSGVWQKR